MACEGMHYFGHCDRVNAIELAPLKQLRKSGKVREIGTMWIPAVSIF